MQRIRVLIAEDDEGAREALSRLLELDEALDVVGAAADAREAAALAAQQPDVALVDVRMPGGGGPEATRRILDRSPSTRILALSAHGDRRTVLEMIRAGARGYIVKGAPGQQIVDNVLRAARGEGVLATEVASGVLGELAGHLEREERETARLRTSLGRVRSVLDGGSIRPVFQPIVDLRSGDVVGYEALTRFDADPPRPPDLWFLEAAEVGLGTELELAALRSALVEAAMLPLEPYVSINLSPETALSRDLLDTLQRLPIHRTVLEITEHAPVTNYVALNAAVGALRQDGGRLAIDDAGAGFASLTHILRLNPEFIKLDVSLTRGIDEDRARRALAKALISFAEEIGATIVAEGIETRAELEALRELEVGFGQGYYLGRPRPLRELDRDLRVDLIA